MQLRVNDLTTNRQGHVDLVDADSDTVARVFPPHPYQIDQYDATEVAHRLVAGFNQTAEPGPAALCLDQLAAALETCLAHYGNDMPPADRQNREALVAEARRLQATVATAVTTKPPAQLQIAVIVRGGVVEDVYCAQPFTYDVVDYDNLKLSEEDPEAAAAEILRSCGLGPDGKPIATTKPTNPGGAA